MIKRIIEWAVVGALLVREERRRGGRQPVIDAHSRVLLPPDVAGADRGAHLFMEMPGKKCGRRRYDGVWKAEG